ncbi:hypothetical protein F5148DRAFT_1367683 [Russula earlei]|uniref:Uncharacterized protein n=1 Tax=Russula earlei TaxID=71964 RepID=A0ACC0UAJ3_9AGAM|nr:hypothetical protein F5148DRAFT_1367683 [Russula earlei]
MRISVFAVSCLAVCMAPSYALPGTAASHARPDKAPSHARPNKAPSRARPAKDTNSGSDQKGAANSIARPPEYAYSTNEEMEAKALREANYVARRTALQKWRKDTTQKFRQPPKILKLPKPKELPN